MRWVVRFLFKYLGTVRGAVLHVMCKAYGVLWTAEVFLEGWSIFNCGCIVVKRT